VVSSEELAAALSGGPPRSIGNSAARGVVWTTLGNLANRLSGLLLFLVLARLLLPAEFGILAAAAVFVALSRTLVDAGLTRTLVQRPHLRAAHLDSALLVNAGLGAVLSLALLVTAPLIASLYGMPDLEPVLMALAVVPFMAGLLSVPESILRRQLRFRSVAARTVLAAVLSDIIGIVLALLGAGVWALVAQTISSVVIAAVVLWASVRWRPGTAWERSAIGELLGFGVHVLGISVLGFVNRRAGELIVGITLGAVALSYFAVSMRILSLCMDVLVANFSKVAFPVFSRVADDPSRSARAYLRITEMTTLVAFPCFAVLALFGRELAPVVFGSQWADAGTTMSILALIGPAQSLAIFTNTLMLSMGRSKLALRWTAVQALTLVLGFLVGSAFGLTVVAVTYTALTWVLMFIGIRLVRGISEVTFADQVRTLSVPVLGCLAMVPAVVALDALTDLGPVMQLLVGGPLTLIAYAAVAVPARLSLIKELVRQLTGRQRRRPVPTKV
jgi:O-antigen/teichoic acid export membrane protein